MTSVWIKFFDTSLQIIWFSVLGAVLPSVLLSIPEEAGNCQGVPVNPLHPLSPLEVFCTSALLAGALLSVLGLEKIFPVTQTAAHQKGQSNAHCHLSENAQGLKILTCHSHKTRIFMAPLAQT